MAAAKMTTVLRPSTRVQHTRSSWFGRRVVALYRRAADEDAKTTVFDQLPPQALEPWRLRMVRDADDQRTPGRIVHDVGWRPEHIIRSFSPRCAATQVCQTLQVRDVVP